MWECERKKDCKQWLKALRRRQVWQKNMKVGAIYIGYSIILSSFNCGTGTQIVMEMTVWKQAGAAASAAWSYCIKQCQISSESLAFLSFPGPMTSFFTIVKNTKNGKWNKQTKEAGKYADYSHFDVTEGKLVADIRKS